MKEKRSNLELAIKRKQVSYRRIEPIMKEMWVWDEDKENAKLKFVLFSDFDPHFPYVIMNTRNNVTMYSNASETNPNDKEPKVGDKGYFWTKYMEENNTYMYGEIMQVPPNENYEYCTTVGSYFTYFSNKKQPWMK